MDVRDLALELEPDPGALEQLTHILLVAPHQRRADELRLRREVRAHGAEEIPD
jgi:hypothetical protein